jgi:hypothetical protein
MADTDIIDGTVRNQVLLRRYLRREVRKMLELVARYDRKMAKVLRRRWDESLTLGSEPLKQLYKEIAEVRDEMIKEANKRARQMTRDLAPTEQDREWGLLALLLGLSGKKPKRPTLVDILDTPFASGDAAMSTYREWMGTLADADRRRIQDVLTHGAVHDIPKNEILLLFFGTSANRFADGRLARTRMNMEALLETLVNHISLIARESIWASSDKVVGAYWASVLDSRTTAICRGRDGKVVMFGNNPPPKGASLLEPPTARPPAHVRCRSTMVALRKGAIPDRRTYEEWLGSQSEKLQNEILGKQKAILWRQGKVSLDKFVDESGKELTIKQLLKE